MHQHQQNRRSDRAGRPVVVVVAVRHDEIGNEPMAVAFVCRRAMAELEAVTKVGFRDGETSCL